MHPKPRAVVFDLDGLMFNTEDLYDLVGDQLLRRRGCRFTPELKAKMMGRPGKIALAIMIEMHGLDDTVEILQSETDEIFVELLESQLAPMPGLLPLLDAIDVAGLPKAIATSSRRSFAEDVLSRFELLPRFEFVLTSESVIQGKPHPEIYLTAAERLNIPPETMMVLEDSPHGCRAAVDAGALAVAVPCRHTRGGDFTGASLVADSLLDERLYELLAIDGYAS